jgi:hypothetical protein
MNGLGEKSIPRVKRCGRLIATTTSPGISVHLCFTNWTRLANGNTIFAKPGKGGHGPQLIEVTRDKKVAWVLQDWKEIGDAAAVQILDDPDMPEIPGQSEHS